MTNLPLKTTTDFIRRNTESAQLALLVAKAVPDLRKKFIKAVRERIERGLREFERSPAGHWHLEVRWQGRPKYVDRMRLYKKGHWSSDDKNGGIWIQWKEDHQDWDSAWWHVGVQGHGVAEPNLSEDDLRACFPTGAAGPDQGGWFSGSPMEGDTWIGWGHLLCKTDDEIQRFAESTVALMTALTEVIDRADHGRPKGGSPSDGK